MCIVPCCHQDLLQYGYRPLFLEEETEAERVMYSAQGHTSGEGLSHC